MQSDGAYDCFMLVKEMCTSQGLLNKSVLMIYYAADIYPVDAEKTSFIRILFLFSFARLRDALAGDYPTDADFIEIPITTHSSSRVNSMPGHSAGGRFSPFPQTNRKMLTMEPRSMEASVSTAYPTYSQPNASDNRYGQRPV